MSLRARLTLCFALGVLVPLLLGALGLGIWLDRSLTGRATAELRADQRAALAVLRTRSAEAAGLAGRLAADDALARALAAGEAAKVGAAVERLASGGFTVAVTGADGAVLAQTGPAPAFLPGFDPPPLSEALAAGRADPRRSLFVREFVDVGQAGCAGGCDRGRVVAGFWMDGNELDRLRAGGADRDLTLVVAGRAVASTRAGLTAGPLPVAGSGLTRLELAGRSDHALATAWAGGLGLGQSALVVSQPVEATVEPLRRLAWGLAALLALAAGLVLAGAFVLARLVGEPLRDLARQAERTATGDFTRAPPHTGASGEVGDLARALDAMRLALGDHVRALRASRDEVTRSMTRVGDVLASSDDLPKLLRVVLEAAVRARQAKAGALLLLDAERATLVPRATVGLQVSQIGPVAVGEGVAGAVAASGRAAVVPGQGTAPLPAVGEPGSPTQVSVPLLARGQVLGVLSVYGREAGGPFTGADAEALAAFAGQAAVGIENLRLHEEARRLSVTDEMTGIWNFRFFGLRIEEEIERARRFKRDVSLLLVDVDHFKAANDRHGHQQGDQILRELAARVSSSIRDVDTFARYGGEEFVLILPETDTQGARAAAEKIRLGIGGRPFESLDDGDPIAVTISVGVACYPRHATATDPLIHAADEALYRAKTNGRNRVEVADELIEGG
jgi:two-component system cell cycle response regulator